MSRRTISFSEDGVDTEDEDDPQPSAKVLQRSHQERGVGVTPGKFKKLADISDISSRGNVSSSSSSASWGWRVLGRSVDFSF